MMIVSPRQLLAAIPHLLAFHPTDSLVCVGLDDQETASVARLDWPPGDHTPPEGFLNALRHSASPSYVLVVYTEADAALADVVHVVGAMGDVPQLDVLHVRGQRWRSLLCSDDNCCPGAGHLLDASSEPIAVEFVAQGSAPFASREDLAQCVAARALTNEQAAARDAAFADMSVQSQHMTSVNVKWALEVVASPHATNWPDAARLCGVLADFRGRDAVLRHLLDQPQARMSARSTLIDLVTRCPVRFVAPVATTLAGVVWLDGIGSLARVAIDRALDADADYSLARLLDRALANGVPPSVWAESLAAVTVDECLAA